MPLMSTALKQAGANGAMGNAAAAHEALDVVQEQQFGMAPAVLGFRLKRLNQGSSATLRGKRMAQELLTLMTQPLSGRDSDAVTKIEGQLATQRAEGDRIAADPRRISPKSRRPPAWCPAQLESKPEPR